MGKFHKAVACSEVQRCTVEHKSGPDALDGWTVLMVVVDIHRGLGKAVWGTLDEGVDANVAADLEAT